MARRSRPLPADDDRYSHQTQRPLHSLAFLAAPLIFYQLAALRYGHDVVAPDDLARLLAFFGATAWFLPPLLIAVVLLGQHVGHRYRWEIRPGVLAGMLAESVALVLPLYSMSYLQSRFLAAGVTSQPTSALSLVLHSLGAGIYEEFIFRLVLVSGVLLVFVDILGLRRDAMALVAVLVGGLLFSAYHLSGAELSGAEAFPWQDFFFRALAGWYLGGLYVWRGFGIAVGTHVIWNLYAFSTV